MTLDDQTMTDQEDSLGRTTCDGQDGTGPPDAEGTITVTTLHKNQANIPIGAEFYSGVGADNNLYLGKIDPNGFLGASSSRFVQGMRVLSINGLNCLGLPANDASVILECMQGEVTLVAVDPLQNDLGSPHPVLESDPTVEHYQTTELSLQAAEEGALPNQTLVAPTPPSENSESSSAVDNTSNSNSGQNDQPCEANRGNRSIPNGQGGEVNETPKEGEGSIRGWLRDCHCKLTFIYISGWIYLITFLKKNNSCNNGTTDDWYSTDDEDCDSIWVEMRYFMVSVGH